VVRHSYDIKDSELPGFTDEAVVTILGDNPAPGSSSKQDGQSKKRQ